ncbi:hypothetical protein NHQ30_002594 [Ciborinia camelliae]|nr:hypothetical protein NHQ30_002594 [Ciborinia camelliae]
MKRPPTASRVESYQQKVLQGITEINTKMQKLPIDDRMEYLSNAQSSLSLRIDEVRVYIEQLNAPNRAQDLASMRVVEQDLLRIQTLIQDLQQKHHRSKNTSQIPIHSTTVRREEAEDISRPTVKAEEKPVGEKSAIRGILRQPREEFTKGSSSISRGTGKVKAVKQKFELN